MAALLKGMMRNMLSADAVYLSVMGARKHCPQVSDADFKKIAQQFLNAAAEERKMNPLSILF